MKNGTMKSQIEQDTKALRRKILGIIFSGFFVATAIEYIYPFMVPLTITIVPTELFIKTYTGIGVIPTIMFIILIYYLYHFVGTLTKKLHPSLDVQGYLREVSRLVRFYIGFRLAIYLATMTSFFLYHWFFLLPNGITEFNDPIKLFYVVVSGLGPLAVTLTFVKIWYDHHLGKLIGEFLTTKDHKFLEQVGSVKRYALITDTLVPILTVNAGIFLIATSLILLEVKKIPLVTWMWVVIFGFYLVALVIIQYFAFYKPFTRLHRHFRELVSGEADWTSKVTIEATHELGDIIRMYNILIGRIQKSLSLVLQSSQLVATQIDFLTKLFHESVKENRLIKKHVDSTRRSTNEQKIAVATTTEYLEKLFEGVNATVTTIEEISSDISESLDALRIVAFNAELEASRIKHESIYVLAENVVSLASEIRQVNERVLEALHSLQQEMDNLLAQTG